MSNNSASFTETGVYITDVSNGIHSIESADISRTAFIGLAKKGPVNKPIKMANFEQFERSFGPLVKEYHLGYCVHHFFLNGGAFCYVIRVQSVNGEKFASDKTVLGRVGSSKAKGTGMHSLDSIDYFNILCIPPYNKKNTVSNTVYRNALKYCEQRRAIIIIDPPYTWTKNNAGKLPNVDEIEKVIGNLRHPNAALYFPPIRAQDQVDGNNMRTFVPSGVAAGIIARTDSTRGVWKAPPE